jgi:hypothetical protein
VADLARDVQQLAVGGAPEGAAAEAQSAGQGVGLPLTPIAARPEKGKEAEVSTSTPQPTLLGAGTPGTGGDIGHLPFLNIIATRSIQLQSCVCQLHYVWKG